MPEQTRDGTDLRVEYDEHGDGWYDPYTITMLEICWGYSGGNDA